MDIVDSLGTTRVVLLAVSCVLCLICFVKHLLTERTRLPPGPYGLPVVGYMPFLTTKPHTKFMQLGKKYGDIFSVQMGSRRVVVLNSAKVIKEVLNKTEFLGRPDQSNFFVLPMESPFFASGNIWEEHRKFALRVLNRQCERKMLQHLEEEIHYFLRRIKDEAGRPCDVNSYLAASMTNNISALIFGKRFEYNDPEKAELDYALNAAIRKLSKASAVMFFPWVTKLPVLWKTLMIERLRKIYHLLVGTMRKKIEEHKESLNQEDHRDVIDSYLSEVEMKQKTQNNPTTFSDHLLPDALISLYGAGSETVQTTLSWCIYIMAVYPEVQRKVQKEIDEIVSDKGFIYNADQKYLPYTKSVLMEIQRWKTVVPLPVPRMTTVDTVIREYHIPRGTFVMTNLWAVHHDPDQWDSPDDFNPERFLSSDGQSVTRNGNYMPFSFGKRSCSGEGLAVAITFLYFTNILHNFTVKLPEGQTFDLEGTMGITFQTKPHQLCYVQRH